MAVNNPFKKNSSGSFNTPGIMLRNVILEKIKKSKESDAVKLGVLFFLLVQIGIVCVLLFTTKEKLSFFRDAFSSNLLGGIVMCVQDIAFGLVDLKNFGNTLKAIPQDYRQFLFSGIQYSALMILYKTLQKCQWPKVFQFIHGIFFVLSTGLLNSYLTKTFLLGEKNLYVRICSGYLKAKETGSAMRYIWQPAICWILVIILLFGAFNALLESVVKMIRYILIVASMISVMALVELLLINRVNNDGANAFFTAVGGWGSELMEWNGLIPAIIFIVTISGFCWTVMTMAEAS